MNASRKYSELLADKSQVLFIYAFLIVLMIVAEAMNKLFITGANLTNLVTASLPYILVSFGQTTVILSAGIDLSVGATVCLANVICATMMTNGSGGFWPGLSIAAASGALVGLANGVIITKGRIQPIIATLATQSMVLGLALLILPAPGGSVNTGFAAALSGMLFGWLPVPLLIGIIVTVIIWITLNRTRFGNAIFAVGGNEAAAFSAGINVARQKTSVYFISGLLSAFAGIFLASQMYSGDPTVGVVGVGFTMNSIATAVVGGTSLAGGKGGVIGSVAGVFILMIINNLLNLVGVSSFYQYVLQGAILILALTVSSIRAKR